MWERIGDFLGTVALSALGILLLRFWIVTVWGPIDMGAGYGLWGLIVTLTGLVLFVVLLLAIIYLGWWVVNRLSDLKS